MLTAALFDLDGTLLDSNDAHVRAWHEAIEKLGYNVAPDRIAVEIGKGGDKLVPDLLGRGAEHEDGDALRAAHDAAFVAIVEREGLLPMPGAKALVAALRERGLKLALATSTSAKMLETCKRASGIAWREMFDVVVDAGDVRESKPAPDIVAAAVAKLRVSPAACVMFGDTPWDAQSAKHAGVVLVGVRCGGNSEAVLRRAGARVTYRDPAAIEIAEMLRISSPGALVLDAARLDALMQHALDAAAVGMADGEVPIGAVIARGDGEIIGRGWNRLNRTRDRTRHAEIEAFHDARLDPDARDLVLVSTLEPCVMCLGAAMESAIDTVIYALRAPEDNGTSRVEPPTSADNQMPRIVGDVRTADSVALFEDWLARADRNRAQEPFVRGVLHPDPHGKVPP